MDLYEVQLDALLKARLDEAKQNIAPSEVDVNVEEAEKRLPFDVVKVMRGMEQHSRHRETQREKRLKGK